MHVDIAGTCQCKRELGTNPRWRGKLTDTVQCREGVCEGQWPHWMSGNEFLRLSLSYLFASLLVFWRGTGEGEVSQAIWLWLLQWTLMHVNNFLPFFSFFLGRWRLWARLALGDGLEIGVLGAQLFSIISLPSSSFQSSVLSDIISKSVHVIIQLYEDQENRSIC